jgi:hypothetical protein
MKYTPPPWESQLARGRQSYNVWADGDGGKRIVAEVWEARDVPLITAAPELVDALRAMVSASDDFPFTSPDMRDATEAASALLAKLDVTE